METTPGILMDAMELSTTHQPAIWDAITLAGAAQAGFTWRGVTVRNPFGPDF